MKKFQDIHLKRSPFAKPKFLPVERNNATRTVVEERITPSFIFSAITLAYQYHLRTKAISYNLVTIPLKFLNNGEPHSIEIVPSKRICKLQIFWNITKNAETADESLCLLSPSWRSN